LGTRRTGVKKDRSEKFPKELQEEIVAYLEEVRSDLDQYLGWSVEEVRATRDVARGSEVIEDAIHRLLLISWYLATFFEDTEPSQLLADITSQVTEEQAREEAKSHGKLFYTDPANRTRH
jgi:hypothetical protein